MIMKHVVLLSCWCRRACEKAPAAVSSSAVFIATRRAPVAFLTIGKGIQNRAHSPNDLYRCNAAFAPEPARMTVVDRRSFVLGIGSACVLAALGAPGFAHAQAESNPSLNAQLLVAARQGNLAQVERALDAGAAPGSRNRLGKTALLLAAEKGNLPIVETMLKRGADVNQASLEGVTPLMAASYVGAAPVVQQLLAAGARTDLRDRMSKPAIVYAAGQGQAGAVDALLASGIDVNAAYEHQLTALMWAAGQGQLDTVKLLLERGARRDLRDDRGLTAAEIARQAGQSAVAAALGGS
jgi:ankyrin repeat protein